jgi:hypothetical protein
MDSYWNIRSILERYLAGRLDLEHMEDEFVPLVPMLSSLAQDHPAASLASRVELLLAEMSRGDRAEDDLRAALREMLPMSVTVILPARRSLRNVGSALTYFVPGVRNLAPHIKVAADSETASSKRLAWARE